MTLIRLETKVPKLIIIHFEDKEFSGGQGEQSLIGRSEAQNLFVRVQPGHLLFGNLGHLSSLLPVEEDGFQRRRLPVDERQADTVTQRRVREVGSAAGKLLPLGRLDKTCKEKTLSSLCHPLLKKKRAWPPRKLPQSLLPNSSFILPDCYQQTHEQSFALWTYPTNLAAFPSSQSVFGARRWEFLRSSAVNAPASRFIKWHLRPLGIEKLSGESLSRYREAIQNVLSGWMPVKIKRRMLMDEQVYWGYISAEDALHLYFSSGRLSFIVCSDRNQIFTCLLWQLFISGLNIKQTSNKSADFSIKDIETRCSKIFTVDECYKILALTHFLTRGTFFFFFFKQRHHYLLRVGGCLCFNFTPLSQTELTCEKIIQ